MVDNKINCKLEKNKDLKICKRKESKDGGGQMESKKKINIFKSKIAWTGAIVASIIAFLISLRCFACLTFCPASLSDSFSCRNTPLFMLIYSVVGFIIGGFLQFIITRRKRRK